MARKAANERITSFGAAAAARRSELRSRVRCAPGLSDAAVEPAVAALSGISNLLPLAANFFNCSRPGGRAARSPSKAKSEVRVSTRRSGRAQSSLLPLRARVRQDARDWGERARRSGVGTAGLERR